VQLRGGWEQLDLALGRKRHRERVVEAAASRSSSRSRPEMFLLRWSPRHAAKSVIAFDREARRDWPARCSTRKRQDADGPLAPATLNAAVLSTIRRHCAAHPNAADTVDGVHRWWLAGLACPLDDVRAALEHLVATGELDRRTLVDGTEIFFAVGD
jgi:hypothetical protein